jgi:hypothetical protein
VEKFNAVNEAERAIVLGLADALLAMLSVADVAPALLGLYVTLIVQLAPGATIEEQPLVWEKATASVPVMVTAVVDSAALPVLVTVTTCGALLATAVWAAKVTVLGLALIPAAEETGGAGGAVGAALPPLSPTQDISRPAAQRVIGNAKANFNTVVVFIAVAFDPRDTHPTHGPKHRSSPQRWFPLANPDQWCQERRCAARPMRALCAGHPPAAGNVPGECRIGAYPMTADVRGGLRVQVENTNALSNAAPSPTVMK